MDIALYEYENTFDITLGLTKSERLQVREFFMTHAKAPYTWTQAAHPCVTRWRIREARLRAKGLFRHL